MRVCGLTKGWKWFCGLGAAGFAVGAAIAWGSGFPWLAACLFAGAPLAWAGLRLRLEYDDESIAFKSAFVTRTLARASISARRVRILPNGARDVLLVSSLAGEKPLRIPEKIALAPELRAWIDALPDLEAAESRLAEERLIEQIGLDALSRRRKVARLFRWLSSAFAVWAAVWPHPYHVALLANLGLFAAAFVLTAGGGYALATRHGEPRPSLYLALVLPAFALALRMSVDVHLVSWDRVGALTLSAGAVIACALLLADREARRRPLLFLRLLAMSSVLAFGGLVYANSALDASAPARCAARVLATPVRDEPARVVLRLEPWGSTDRFPAVNAPAAFYGHVKPGDRVGVRVYPGRLEIPWFVIDPP